MPVSARSRNGCWRRLHLSGLDRLRSSSDVGLSLVFAEFAWGTDIYRARQLVQERVQTVLATLPKEAKPFKWLVVFDGDNRFVFQGRPNEVMVMDRQPDKDKKEKSEDGQ